MNLLDSFLKIPHIIFHETPSSGSRIVPCRWIDMMNVIVAFNYFANVPNDENWGLYDIYSLLTAIGLTPGGSTTVHIYIQTVHRTTQWNRIHRTYITISIHKCNNTNVCPIQFSFLLFIWFSIGFWWVIFHSSSFVILSVHFVFIIHLMHLFTNICNVLGICLAVFPVSQVYNNNNTDLTFVLNICN